VRLGAQMLLLKLVPKELLLVLAIGLGIVAGVQSVRLHWAAASLKDANFKADQAAIAKRQAESALETIKAMHAQVLAEETAKAGATTAQLKAIAQEAENAKAETEAVLSGAIARADDAERRLRQRAQAIAAGSRANSGGAAAGGAGSAQQCEDATAAARMLADVLGSTLRDGRARAEFGDRAAEVAEKCGQVYDAMRAKLNAP
jgi:hypothetical protein